MRPRAVAAAVMTVMLTTTELVRATPLDAHTPSLTARQVLDRIKANIGVPWMEQTVDTFKDGDPDNEHLFTLPETTLDQLAVSVRDKLGAPTLRVVGDPKRRVSKVAMAPGFAGFPAHLLALRRDDVQVLIIGEAHEWETVEYVADARAAGVDKSLIVIGHIPSEQAGMEDFAHWLAPLVNETTVRFVPAVDFFWLPR